MVEKAKIIVLDNDGRKIDEIPVMFNPRDYSVSTEAELNGEGSGIQFKKVNIPDFTVTLFFDTYEDSANQDVREKTQKISELVVPTVEKKDTKQPPVCIFSWGGFGYKGILYKLAQKFTMFLSTGTPVRAELTLTFKSVVTKQEDALFKGQEACRKLWLVKEGDRLDLIAAKTLKDSSQWRKIADENNISNPMMFPAKDDIGRTLKIPD